MWPPAAGPVAIRGGRSAHIVRTWGAVTAGWRAVPQEMRVSQGSNSAVHLLWQLASVDTCVAVRRKKT